MSDLRRFFAVSTPPEARGLPKEVVQVFPNQNQDGAQMVMRSRILPVAALSGKTPSNEISYGFLIAVKGELSEAQQETLQDGHEFCTSDEYDDAWMQGSLTHDVLSKLSH